MRQLNEIYLNKRGTVIGLRYSIPGYGEYGLMKSACGWRMGRIGTEGHEVCGIGTTGLLSLIDNAQAEADRQRGRVR